MAKPKSSKKSQQTAIKNKKNEETSHYSAASEDEEGDDSGGEGEFTFTHNNKDIFPTTEDRRTPFRIEFGESISNLEEKIENKVLRVCNFDEDLDQYLSTRPAASSSHGGIEVMSDVTRELMKGIIVSFCKLVRETQSEDEIMYLENLSNYLICGIESYDRTRTHVRTNVFSALDSEYCPPINVIIVKNNKNGIPQKSLADKVLAISKVLKLVYGEEHYSCDKNEWVNFYNGLTGALPPHVLDGSPPPHGFTPDPQLSTRIKNSMEDLEKHHVLWHWRHRINFVKDVDKLLHTPFIKDIVITIFDQFDVFDESHWKPKFVADPPLDSCFHAKLVFGSVGSTGSHGGGGVGSTGSHGGGGVGSTASHGGGGVGRTGGGTGLIGGVQTSTRILKRRSGGKLFITKTRNAFEHVYDCHDIPNPNYIPNSGTNTATRHKFITTYTHITPNTGQDAFKQMHYVPLRILELFPDLWNYLVPTLRAKGFKSY